MPQMAPMLWLPLMIMFTIMILTMNTMLYFMINVKKKSLNMSLKQSTFNLKW
nr:ATPase subunit 8 [Myrmedobia distinguenda]